MKTSRILILTLAVAAAGGAFLLANTPRPAVVEATAPVAAPPQTDDILAASKDLPVGTVVAEGDTLWQAWPKTAVAPGMIVRTTEPNAMQDLKGSIARGALYTGEPVRREKLIKGAGSGFMSAILPSGSRAVAINIDAQGSTSAGGFILPNDRVDVVHTSQDQGRPNGGQASVVSETILTNVRVLAIGQNVQEKNGQSVVVGSNATLELDPVQAEAVILAQRTGQLSLTLRSVLDANADKDGVAERADHTMTIVRYGTAAEGELR